MADGAPSEDAAAAAGGEGSVATQAATENATGTGFCMRVSVTATYH